MATAVLLFELPVPGGTGVGYALYNADATLAASRTTSGITETPASSGMYSANPTLPAGFVTGFFIADDGTNYTRGVVESPFYLVDEFLKRNCDGLTGEASRSPLNALRLLMNKRSVSGTSLVVFKENDSTTAWTATLTAAPGADPVSAIDPA